MRRRLALLSMFALFGAAYATLDRMPQAVVSVLRGAAHVLRFERAEAAAGSVD